MKQSRVPGYAGNILRVDLTTRTTSSESLDEATLRRWVGGTGLGAHYLYSEVPPGVDWDSPDNRIIIASGPFGGTSIMGSGTISVVTKGPMTNGATSSQANGFMGAYMKFAGFDGIVLQGQSPEWVYLYLHDGIAELRPAAHLLGLDTWELQDTITTELGKSPRALSVFGIGPAGENLVRFAAIAGDHGHVAGHNGTGAVLGSKRVKAIVAERTGKVEVLDAEAVRAARQSIFDSATSNPFGASTAKWGTSLGILNLRATGQLPVKNYTTSLFEAAERFSGETYRKEYELRPAPCWACQFQHLHHITVTSGPYAGTTGEEPEYEQWAAWGPLIGNTEVGGAFLLANLVDRLGMETNEASWVVAWAMECYEKGLMTSDDLGGLELTWGNVEAVRQLLGMIARREGIGALLAEGARRASAGWGKGSEQIAIYTIKGGTPLGHDHRAGWSTMVDTSFSSTGTIEVGPPVEQTEVGAPPPGGDRFSPEYLTTVLAKTNGRMAFEDSLGTCKFTIRTKLEELARALQVVTGWDFTVAESMAVGRRTTALLRVFNIRHGIGPETELPSMRYGSTPVDGPAQGRSITPHWDEIRERYFTLMGWDLESGRPLPATLEALGLESVVADIWPD